MSPESVTTTTPDIYVNKGGRPRKVAAAALKLPEAVILKAEAELYKQDFYEFLKACFRLVSDGDEYVEMFHVGLICKKLEVAGKRLARKQKRDKHFNVNVPPRTLKSIIMNVTYPVWLWLHNPHLKVVSVTHSTKLASKLIEGSARLIQSEWFQARYGDAFKLTKANTEEYMNDRGGERAAFGTSSHIMGITADLILLDDIMDSKLANSDAYRTSIFETIRKDVLSRQRNKSISLIINIQQRVHIEDMSGWIIRNKGDQYEHIKLPSEATSADQVSPPEWFQYYQNGLLADIEGFLSRADLRNELIDKGTLGYAQQHLQEPVAPGGGMFKEEWFDRQLIDYADFQVRLNGRRPEWQLFIDGAETTNPKNDPTCLLLACKLDNQLYIKQIKWYYQEFAELVKAVNNFLFLKAQEGTPVTRVHVEGKSIGKQLISVMRSSSQQVPFIELPHAFGKDPKYVRANSAVPFVEAGKLWLIKDTTLGKDGAWNEKFLHEVTSFTNGKGKTHDDAVDTMAYAVNNAKQSRITFG